MNWEKDFEEQYPDDKVLVHNMEERVAIRERERLIKILQDYLDLTTYSVEVEGAEENKEWEAGFRSALALILCK